jgi:head-tail adaptor
MTQRVGTKRRKIKAGDLSELIMIRFRDIEEPMFGSADATEQFSQHIDVYAKVETKDGTSTFNGITRDIPISHVIYMRYEEGINPEMWIELFGGQLVDILRIENMDNKDHFLKMTCSLKGDKGYAAATA